jgi:hypothetical protein
MCFAIADRTAAQTLLDHLDRLGAEHAPVTEASRGWMVEVTDPGGIAIRSTARTGTDD